MPLRMAPRGMYTRVRRSPPYRQRSQRRKTYGSNGCDARRTIAKHYDGTLAPSSGHNLSRTRCKSKLHGSRPPAISFATVERCRRVATQFHDAYIAPTKLGRYLIGDSAAGFASRIEGYAPQANHFSRHWFGLVCCNQASYVRWHCTETCASGETLGRYPIHKWLWAPKKETQCSMHQQRDLHFTRPSNHGQRHGADIPFHGAGRCHGCSVHMPPVQPWPQSASCSSKACGYGKIIARYSEFTCIWLYITYTCFSCRPLSPQATRAYTSASHLLRVSGMDPMVVHRQ